MERRGRKVAEIDELNLDNCKSAAIHGLTEEFTSLKTLSLINVGLTTLKAFPCLPALLRLELSDNWISGGLESLSKLPKLKYLSLSGNKISAVDTLKPLKSISTLRSLDLLHCDVTNVENFRGKVFDLIPSLIYLDGYDKDDNEMDEDEEHGDDDEEEEGGEEVEDEIDEEDIDEEEELDEEEEETEDVPLDALYKSYDPEGDGDYEAAEEDEDDEIEEEEESMANSSQENEGGGRGKKRKLEDGEEQ